MAKTKGVVKQAGRAVKPSQTKVAKATKATKAARATKATKATKTTKTKASAKPGKTGRGPVPPVKLPAVAIKPKKPSAPSLPLPPPPPPPPAARDELISPRDIGRLLRYGEPFGPHKIDVRMLPLQLPATSGALAVVDPALPRTWRTFDRPVSPGMFRVMLSVARSSDRGGDRERLAAVVIHVGRPPIAKWTVAHYRNQKRPKSIEQLPRVTVTSGCLLLVDAGTGAAGVDTVPPATGVTPQEISLTDGRRALALPCGDGEFAAYWAIDAADKPVCLVIDFDVFSQKDWKAKPR